MVASIEDSIIDTRVALLFKKNITTPKKVKELICYISENRKRSKIFTKIIYITEEKISLLCLLIQPFFQIWAKNHY